MVRMIDGNKVRACRERLGWSRLDLARHTGLCVEAIAMIETGEGTDPDRETVLVLAKALLVDVEDISE
jgi:transcriptional regulator with XRE-family HTH domain